MPRFAVGLGAVGMMIKSCLNGARRRSEHAALPISAAELAVDVVEVVAAGADAVHLHVKDEHGVDTLEAGALADVLGAVRSAAPGVPLGVTTGAWALPDPDARLRAVRSWTVLPDFASVNWHEEGADEVAGVLLDRGIGVEAGLWHAGAVDAWLRSPHRDRCLRVLLELPDGLDPEETEAEAEQLLRRVEAGVGPRFPLLLHGEGTSAWPGLRVAARRRLATRIGLEDVLVMPDGSPAPGNAALLIAARSLIALADTATERPAS